MRGHRDELMKKIIRKRGTAATPFRFIVFKFAFVVIFLFTASFLFAGCKQKAVPLPHTSIKAITVVIDNNYPPYSFVDSKGVLQGISIDQWNLWEKKTGINVEITGMSWGNALVSMKLGKFDVIDTIFYNESRATQYDFTDPYATLDVPIYFSNNISGITDAESVKGFPIAVKSGDAVIDVLMSHDVENLLVYQNYQEIIQDAANHEVVVFAIDKPPADYFLHQYGIQNNFNATVPIYSGQFHRAVIKGNTELLSVINAGFASISKSEYETINRKWFGTPVIDTALLRNSGYILGGILLIFVLLGIWNRSLHIRVNNKTKTLQESEARFRTIFEKSPVSLWVEDFSDAIRILDGLKDQAGSDLHTYLASHPETVEQCFTAIHVKDVNAATVSLFNAKSKQDLLGTLEKITKNNPPELMLQQLIAMDKRLLTNVWDGINNSLTGEKLFVHLQWEVEPGFEKDMSRVILSIVDFTAIKKVENELSVAKERLSLALQAALMGVWDWDILNDHLYWDDKMHELYGVNKKTFNPVYESWLKSLHPDDREKNNILMDQVLKGEKKYETVFRIILPDGAIRHIKSFGHVLRDPDGRPIRVIGINFDMTEIIRLETAREIVSDAQTQIGQVEDPAEIYKIVGKSVQKIAGDAIIWITEVDESYQAILVKEIYTDPKSLKDFNKKFNFDPLRTPILIKDIPQEDLKLFRSGKLEKYPFDLYRLITGKLTKAACEYLENNLHYAFIYKMGFVYEEKHIGGLSIVSKRDISQISSFIESIMNFASLALKRIASEKTLQKSEEQFHSLYDQSPIGIAFSNIDFGFTSANSAFCHMMGYSEEAITKLSFKEITYPDDLAGNVALMKRLVSGNIPSFTTEKRYVKKDGSIIWGSVTVKGIRDRGGNFISFLAMVEDITDRKVSEAQLAKERQHMQVLMDSIPDSVYFKDLDNRFIRANRATALKFGLKGQQELIGKSDFDFFAPEVARLGDEQEKEIIRTGIPVIGDEKMEVWPHKPATWISTTKMALKDEKGEIIGTFGVVRDITDRKRQEEEIKGLNANLEKKVEMRTKELKLKNQELESFTYTVSHDLKAPLRGISGYSDLLLHDHAGQLDDEGKSYLKKLILSSSQLAQLIEDLLTFSRLERRPVTREELRIKEIVDLVLEQKENEIKNCRAIIHLEIEDELISSSHELLTQIIMNYLDNALKFTSQREVPEIWVQYKNEGKTSILSIRDNGIGFDMKYKEKIFDVFQRLHTIDVFPGTGIGLALVKKAAELLEYRVWAESEPGQGSTFFLEIVK